MAHDDEKFLRLTFDGGRFVGHTAPVDVLAELSTMQALVLRVARCLFFREHSERRRAPAGFVEAAQLYLATTHDNCITAGLVRPSDDHAVYFDHARDLCIQALAAASVPGVALPPEFPDEAVDLLMAFGRRLFDEEALVLHNGVANAARVTQLSRARLFEQLARGPRESIENLDGEIESIDDNYNRFWLRRKERNLTERIEVPFEREQRQTLLEAFGGRPAVRVRVRGLVVASTPRKVKSVEEFGVFDHKRAADVEKLWARLDTLAVVKDGWLEGEGRAPTERAVVRAREVLARLLVDFEWIEKPRVFPMPDGGIQAEWIIGPWACDVAFAPDGWAYGEATHGDTDEEWEKLLDNIDGSKADQLAEWLYSIVEHEKARHV